MKTINLEFTLQELQILAQSLHEMPYKLAAPILQKLDSQVQPQLKDEQQNGNTTD